MKTSVLLSLLLVVFVDRVGQGLVFPILNPLIMDHSSDFLASSVTEGTRHVYFGLVIGVFFFTWFIGAIYIAKISDYIGRKQALIVCLAVALTGYAITILSLYVGNFWLLILGRAITGFSAGSQPVAQAAIVDACKDDAERDRDMGFIVAAVSSGIVVGPIIGAIFSDPDIVGSIASTTLPFVVSFLLVAVSFVMIVTQFHNEQPGQGGFAFRIRDLTDGLVAVKDHPKVLHLLPAFIFFMFATLSIFIFIDNYLTTTFDYGDVGNGVVQAIIGAAVAFSSSFLLKPAQARLGRHTILFVTYVIYVLSCAIIALSQNVYVIMVPLVFFFICFGSAYPTLLGMFSAAVGPKDTGWVMGVATATFCLIGAIMAFFGGFLMDLVVKGPFYLSLISAALGLVYLRWVRKREHWVSLLG